MDDVTVALYVAMGPQIIAVVLLLLVKRIILHNQVHIIHFLSGRQWTMLAIAFFVLFGVALVKTLITSIIFLPIELVAFAIFGLTSWAAKGDHKRNGNGNSPEPLVIHDRANIPLPRATIDAVPYVKKEADEYGLPMSEKAFYSGFTVENFHFLPPRQDNQIALSTRGSKNSIVDATIGTRSVNRAHYGNGEEVYYFKSPNFDFLREQGLDHDVLENPQLFACFVAGFISGKLSENLKRISLKDHDRLDQINETFEEHFGFKMGNPRNDRGVHYIELKSIEAVMSVLRKNEKVRALPFYTKIPHILKPIK